MQDTGYGLRVIRDGETNFMNPIGKYMMIIGAIIFMMGLIWYFFAGRLHWLGRLPGDISLVRHGFRLYFPFTTMLIISVVLTLLFNLFRKLF